MRAFRAFLAEWNAYTLNGNLNLQALINLNAIAGKGILYPLLYPLFYFRSKIPSCGQPRKLDESVCLSARCGGKCIYARMIGSQPQRKNKDMKLPTLALLFAVATAFADEPIPSNASFDVGFSPHNGALETIIKGIHAARSEILVAGYGFTSKQIAAELLDAKQRGIKVEIVVDQKANARSYSAVSFLAKQGIPVRLNNNYPIHHNKFMVFDGNNLETGSFNYTRAAADKNAENVLLLWNVPNLAAVYTKEWHRLWEESVELRVKD